MPLWRTTLSESLVLLLVFSVWMASKKPSNDREWMFDQTVLPTAELSGKMATVRNVRNFEYASATSVPESAADFSRGIRSIPD